MIVSKYTTEVRFICENAVGLRESKGYNSINEIVAEARTKIFDFDYPIFDEAYRPILEKKILKHYYTREIGAETYGLWKLFLDTKMNEIMPYYNKLYESELLEFNPLYTHNLKTKRTNEIEKTNNENENVTDNSSSSNNTSSSSTSHSSGSGNTTEKYSDTPQGALTNVENGTYLTNATINENGTSSDTTASATGSDTQSGRYEHSKMLSGGESSNEDYAEEIAGFSGTSGSKLIKEFRETLLNIDMLVINELEPLFMQLW